MNEVVWRVKQGWVYLLGVVLCLSFAYLGFEETAIKAAGTENTPKQADKQSISAGQEEKAAGDQNAAASSPKPETKAKTTYKYVTTTVPAQQGAVSSALQSQTSQPGGTVVPPPAPKNTVQVKITGLGVYNVEIQDGDTAFDALKKAASENGFSLEYKMYSFGVMIAKIGATEAQGTYYWALYYNGGYSQVGASDLSVKNKDITEWRYESWQ